MPKFKQYIGIDYSGSETPVTCLDGLQVYRSDNGNEPSKVWPTSDQRENWTRKGVAMWLVEQLECSSNKGVPALVGIDHGFSFPLQYFEEHGVEKDWSRFLDWFQCHGGILNYLHERRWPLDDDHARVHAVLEELKGMGNTRWFRATEIKARNMGYQPKSVFHFGVPGQVAYSTHAGIPWLRYLRLKLGGKAHFWPFEGWEVPPGKSAVVEVYPALWSDQFDQGDRGLDEHDAYSVARWLSESDKNGRLAKFLSPELEVGDDEAAKVEGWILGVE